MYSAIVLDQDSVEQLKQSLGRLSEHLGDFLFETKQGQPLPHHMTLSLGPLNKDCNGLSGGEQAVIWVSEIWLNSKIGACAAKVIKSETVEGKEVKSINDHPHVTCCIKDFAKPFHSNQIFDDDDSVWIEFPEDLRLTGTVRECA